MPVRPGPAPTLCEACRNTRPGPTVCAWCEVPFEVQRRPGPVPKFCSNRCRWRWRDRRRTR